MTQETIFTIIFGTILLILFISAVWQIENEDKKFQKQLDKHNAFIDNYYEKKMLRWQKEFDFM